MTHLDGQAPLSKRKDAYVAGISNVEKLEVALKEQQALLAEAESNLTTLLPCYQRYEAALRLKWNCRKMISKVEGKLKNLKRVKKVDFKLNTWYAGGEYNKDTYIYPIRVTPAGRVVVIKIQRGESFYSYNYSMSRTYSGPFWNVVREFMDSGELERVAPLTVLVTMGNLNKILTRFMESEFYKQIPLKRSYAYMKMKDNDELEVLEIYPKTGV